MAGILLAAASRLFNLGLVKIGRVHPDWRRAVTRTRLDDRLVAGRHERKMGDVLG
jgi:hypothetical protein